MNRGCSTAVSHIFLPFTNIPRVCPIHHVLLGGRAQAPVVWNFCEMASVVEIVEGGGFVCL